MCILFVYTLLTVVSHYHLSVLSVSVMCFHKKNVWLEGWVGGVWVETALSIFFLRRKFEEFCWFFKNFAKPLTQLFSDATVWHCQGLGVQSVSMYSFLLPIIRMSTDLTGDLHVYLCEDALDLWHTTLQECPRITPDLLDIYVNIPALLGTSSVILGFKAVFQISRRTGFALRHPSTLHFIRSWMSWGLTFSRSLSADTLFCLIHPSDRRRPIHHQPSTSFALSFNMSMPSLSASSHHIPMFVQFFVKSCIKLT